MHITFFFCFSAYKCCVCNYLLASKALLCITHGMHSQFVTFSLTFRSFWLSLIVFETIACLKDVYLRKAMIVVALNASLNVLLIFNVCHCLLIISLKFSIVGLLCYHRWIYIFPYYISFD